MTELTSTVKGKTAKADDGGLSDELKELMRIMEMDIGELQNLYLEPGGTTQFVLADIETVSL
jgi:hypothetical protein